MALLEVENLRTYFYTRGGVVRAVDNVSFSLEQGETMGIVGESGSGKSVTCYSLLGLIPRPPGKIVSGSARFGGVDLLSCPKEQLRRIQGKRISMIFQDPMTSLNPVYTVGEQIAESIRLHQQVNHREALALPGGALVEPHARDPLGKIRGTQNATHAAAGIAVARIEIVDDLALVPDVIAGGKHLAAQVEELVGDGRGQAEAASGVFGVGDHQVNAVRLHQVTEMIVDDLAPRAAKDVADEKNLHAVPVFLILPSSWGTAVG